MDFNDPEFADGQPQENAFEEALKRIQDGKRTSRHNMLKGPESKKQAMALVKNMMRFRDDDVKAAMANQPAIHKAQNMDKIVRIIDRKGFHRAFLEAQGITELTRWLMPLTVGGREEAPISVISGVIKCLQAVAPILMKEDLMMTGIGKEIRLVMMNESLPNELRLSAQALVTDWVSDVIGTKKRKSADEEDETFGDEEEAEEVDDRGRAVKKQKKLAAVMDDLGNARKRTERELSELWQPDAETQKAFDERMKTRHATMVSEKPVFDREALPPSVAPPKRRGKEDPNTAVGKIQAQLSKISNPNKKTWKATVDGVSVSGAKLVYKW